MKIYAVLLLSLAAPAVQAADSIVRIDCMEDTAGAAVSIDGEYRFDCQDYGKTPIGLSAGEHTVRAVRAIDQEYEQVFEQTLSLEAGVPQRLRVSLPGKTLTALGQQMKQAREEQARIAAEQERLRQLQAAVQSDLEKAGSGDLDAMQSLAKRYTNGNGVEVDTEKAQYWQERYDQAAQEAARQKKLAALQEQLDQNSYFYYVGLTPWMLENRLNRGASTYVTLLPAATLFDLTSVPTVYSERKQIYQQIEELETHAARWANPDSMVSQAYDAN